MEKINHYASILFVSEKLWRKKAEEHGFEYTDKSFETLSGIAVNYIIPLYGEYEPSLLTPRKIKDRLIGIMGIKTRKPLCGCVKNRILLCLSNIYSYLIEEDIVDKNPVKLSMPFSRKQKMYRGAITNAEMDLLFPKSHEDLLKLWRTQKYICAFLVLRDTGLRPGELVALKWKDWYAEKRFFPIVKAIEAGTRARLKGTKTGSVKPALVKEETARELEILKAKTKPNPDDFIFAGMNNIPYDTHRLCWNFRAGLKRAGIDKPEYTPYWLRYTFNTRGLENLPDEIVRRLMGHKTVGMTLRYRDADVESLMREADRIRWLLENTQK
jgi:integrase